MRQLRGYATPAVTLAKGGTLSVVNFDSTRHSVTSDDHDASGNALFSAIVDPGGTATVDGVSLLAPGTYPFHCIFHAATMRGTLTISGSGGGVQPAPLSFDQPLTRPRTLRTAKMRIPIEQVGVRVLPDRAADDDVDLRRHLPGSHHRAAGRQGHEGHLRQPAALEAPASPCTCTGTTTRPRPTGNRPGILIAPGKARTYDYPLVDGGRPERAAFFWYHDHRMGATTRNNWLGLQGMFLVTDGKSAKLGLPSGGYDVPLMVSERSFDANNQLVPVMPHGMMMTGPMAPPDDSTVGDRILVNGRYAPYLDVDTHRYRLRLLNTSPFTTYDFALSDGRPFVQVGTGNGLLPKAVVRQDILLGPAQRADVVVDFRGELGKDVVLAERAAAERACRSGRLAVGADHAVPGAAPGERQQPAAGHAPAGPEAVGPVEGLGGLDDGTRRQPEHRPVLDDQRQGVRVPSASCTR